MENLMIRKETERDYAAVENLTRAAFVGAFFSLCRRAGICVDNPATKCCENSPFPSY